jgi:hypothetical protein
MKSAIERSNALYRALEDFIQDGDGLYMPRDAVHEEIDNFLDDIVKRKQRFDMDMLALDNDIADMVYVNIFTEYRQMLRDPDISPQVYMDRLMKSDKFQDGVQMIRGAIMEEIRRR